MYLRAPAMHVRVPCVQLSPVRACKCSWACIPAVCACAYACGVEMRVCFKFYGRVKLRAHGTYVRAPAMHVRVPCVQHLSVRACMCSCGCIPAVCVCMLLRVGLKCARALSSAHASSCARAWHLCARASYAFGVPYVRLSIVRGCRCSRACIPAVCTRVLVRAV
jgi:hypothetical protein